MKSIPKPPELAERAEVRLIILGMILLIAATVIALLSFSSITPSLGDKVFMFVLAFLGGGMMVAMVIHRWFERRISNREDDEWL